MSVTVEIDPKSGFCGGVIRAIDRAEEFLSQEGEEHKVLYSLGSIVHNESELSRLAQKGLVTIGDVDEMAGKEKGSTLFIRAHGEPPSTYEKISRLSLKVIDCTCPVVLKLQDRIREAYSRVKGKGGQVIIFGKVGHAEVLGLVGQVGGDALVVENLGMLRGFVEQGMVNLDGPIEIFSQTTKSPAGYKEVCDELRTLVCRRKGLGKKEDVDGVYLFVNDTICRQVAFRHDQLQIFASSHDVVIFVAGKESSNGKVLSDLCRKVNPRTYHVMDEGEIDPRWFRDGDKVGVCGATSTPKWLLEAVERRIQEVG